MANSRDFTGKNRKFTGTKGITVSKGTTAERVGSESGELRFNTTTDLMEYYDGVQWKPIDAPPSISSITTNDATGSATDLNADGSTIYTITINGGNFGTGLNVQFIGSTGTIYTAGNITRVSSSQITCTTLSSMGTSDDPYDIKVINVSGLSIESLDALTFNAPPVFTVASGQLGTVYNDQVISGTTLNAGATDAEGNTITHTIISGSLPGSGLTLSSSTGAITGTLSGTPSLGNYPFVVSAATTEGTVERQFSIQVIANPFVAATGGTILTSGDFKTHVFTSPGTFTVTNAGTPAGSNSVEYLVVAAGGGGSGSQPGAGGNFDYAGGGGGAGGYRQNFPSPATGGFPVTATAYPITVGASGGATPSGARGTNGNPSIFSTITSTAGGGGGSGGEAGSTPINPGSPGGSGGGGGGSGPSTGGIGNSPPTSPSQGNPGGNGSSTGPTTAAGGGGATTSGANFVPGIDPQIGTAGGEGAPLSPTFFGPTAPSYGTPGPAPGRYFAGGGGGAGGYYVNPGRSGAGGSGGGGAGGGQGSPTPAAVAGTTNTGGGGGGAQCHPSTSRPGAAGGSGIVAIRYKFQ